MTVENTKQGSDNQNRNSFFEEIMQSHLSEEEIYNSYFKKELWTIAEFCALMAGITPENYEWFCDSNNKKMSLQDFEKFKTANRIYEKFTSNMKKKIHIKNFHLVKKHLALSPWKFIQWIAANQIPTLKIFFNQLPLHLFELFLEFQPLNTILKKQPSHHRDYHKALFLKHAEELIDKTEKKMSHTEIINHPQMLWVKSTFKNAKGKRITYTERTIKESWLPKIAPKKRGRPRKIPTKSKPKGPQ